MPDETKTRIAGAAMVKDECDIIELFVRINSRHLDHLFVVDHCSKDRTREILARLRAEGYPLTIYAYDHSDFQQSKVITWLVRQIAASGDYDYIITLDADEFIQPESGTFAESVHNSLSPGECGHIKWQSFVPAHGEYYATDAPLYELFRPRLVENPQFFKVIIPNALAVNCTVTEGNHFITLEGAAVTYSVVNATLQHVPVRSAEQLMGKALIGSHRLSIKVGRGKHETTHWDDLAQRIRNNNYALTHSDVLHAALEYASDGGNFADGKPLFADHGCIGTPEDRIVFRDLAAMDILRKFDVFAESLCREIQQLREK